ncbi:MAG: hypothetical protein ABI811_04765 [Acidobacteriota bacterium]
MNDTRQHAHQLIDSLPETQLSGLVQFLETIVDPVTAALRNAPLDDEPVTEEDRRRLRQTGHGVPMQDVLAEFGLTEADFPR